MSLWAQLDKELATRGASGMSLRRAQSAMKTLKSVFGPGFVLPNHEADLAEIVKVPGDNVPYIVFGTWEDGSVDVIREGGMFSKDTLIGWTHGQSRSEYDAELAAERTVGEDSASSESGGEAAPKGPRGPLPVVSGGRVRGGRLSGGKASDHPWRTSSSPDRRPGAGTVPRRAAGESVVPRGNRKGTGKKAKSKLKK